MSEQQQTRRLSQMSRDERSTCFAKADRVTNPFWRRVFQIVTETGSGWASALAKATDEEKSQ